MNGRGACGRCEVAPGVHRRQDATELQSRGCVNDWSILDCQCDWWAKKANEDINMAVCLRYWGVHPEDTRDHLRRERFWITAPWCAPE